MKEEKKERENINKAHALLCANHGKLYVASASRWKRKATRSKLRTIQRVKSERTNQNGIEENGHSIDSLIAIMKSALAFTLSFKKSSKLIELKSYTNSPINGRLMRQKSLFKGSTTKVQQLTVLIKAITIFFFSFFLLKNKLLHTFAPNERNEKKKTNTKYEERKERATTKSEIVMARICSANEGNSWLHRLLLSHSLTHFILSRPQELCLQFNQIIAHQP